MDTDDESQEMAFGIPTTSHPLLLELGRIIGRLMAEEDVEALIAAAVSVAQPK